MGDTCPTCGQRHDPQPPSTATPPLALSRTVTVTAEQLDDWQPDILDVLRHETTRTNPWPIQPSDDHTGST